jgi:predicted RNA methylase
MKKKEARLFDKFYTKPEIAKKCIECAKSILNLKEYNFLEPSAGSGSFSNQLKCEAYDLYPEGEKIKKADFLLLNPDKEKKYVVIGNPPFGKRGKLAIEFINHASSFSDAICFILPNTFSRYSVQSKICSDLKLIYSGELPKNSFTFAGKDYDLNCVFQIWVKNDFNDLKDLRKEKPQIKNNDFEIWQHNATKQSRKFIDYDWKYATYRQGFKDYNKKFTKKDYDFLRHIVYDTNIQLFFIKPLNENAEKVFLSMDLDSLASKNLRQKGFGKHDFIEYYNSLTKK